MSEQIWYFAVGDEERGPVTETQIRALIGTGNLTRQDLVWREGMDDWIPAGQIPGLFGKEASAKSATSKQARKNTAQPTTSAPSIPEIEPKTASPSGKRKPAIEVGSVLATVSTRETAGRVLFICGFLLVLFSRGCDGLSARYAKRLEAKSALAERLFQQSWDAAKRKLQDRENEILSRPGQSPADRDALNNIRQQQRELDDEKQAELDELRQGKWRSLSVAAGNANENNAIWGFWWQTGFFLGSLLLVAGLATVSIQGNTQERWMGLIMLAIVIFSLFTNFGVWNTG